MLDIAALYAQYQGCTDHAEQMALLAQMAIAPHDLARFLGERCTILLPRPLSYALAVLSKKQTVCRALVPVLERQNGAFVRYLLQQTDAKVRKNTYILLGNLAAPLWLPLLIEQVEVEGTYFALPSLALALGNYTGEDVSAALALLQRRAKDTAVPASLAAEINLAVAKAQDRLAPKEAAAFCVPTKPMLWLLSGMHEQSKVLAQDLKQHGFQVVQVLDEGCVVQIADPAKLSAVRTWYQAFLYRPQCYNVTAAQLPACLHDWLADPTVQALHSPMPTTYRISMTDDKELSLRQLVQSLDNLPYRNSASNYTWEVVIRKRQGLYRCLLLSYAARDERYNYRLEVLPAGINPTTAATLAALTAKHLRQPPAHIVDCCCGSGTLLVEMARRYPTARLTGIDIDGSALDKARCNCTAAGVSVRLLHMDMAKYQPAEPVDCVVGNLPFGTRVGSHDNNEKLYKALVRRLPDWLCPHGFAFLYTTEVTLLSRLLQASPTLQVMAKYKTQSGGLYPCWFAIKRI